MTGTVDVVLLAGEDAVYPASAYRSRICGCTSTPWSTAPGRRRGHSGPRCGECSGRGGQIEEPTDRLVSHASTTHRIGLRWVIGNSWRFRYKQESFVMTHGKSIDVREIVFIGGARREFDQLDQEVRHAARSALTMLQNGLPLTGGRYKLLTEDRDLAEVGEIRLNDDGNAIRIYTTLRHPHVVYVLEAGLKKSHVGGAIPRETKRTVVQRLKDAKTDYELKAPAYEARNNARKAERSLQASRRLGLKHKGS